jgi:hypothetical protein
MSAMSRPPLPVWAASLVMGLAGFAVAVVLAITAS